MQPSLMHPPFRILTGLFVVAALAPCGGCVAFYSHRDVTFRVVDGDTGAALPGATVAVSYEPHLFVLNKPRNRSVRTGARGAVTLPVAKWWIHAGPAVSFAAPGYLPYGESSEPGERLPRGLTPCPDARALCFVIPLYREPAPVVTFVVPDDYEGPVTLDMTPTDRLPAADPGRRDIEIPVPDGGYVEIEATRLLRRDWPVYYRARRANGTPIPRAYVRDPDVPALWSLKTYGDRRLFVVGPMSLTRQIELEVRPTFAHPRGGVVTPHNPAALDAYIDRMRDASAERATRDGDGDR